MEIFKTILDFFSITIFCYQKRRNIKFFLKKIWEKLNPKLEFSILYLTLIISLFTGKVLVNVILNFHANKAIITIACIMVLFAINGYMYYKAGKLIQRLKKNNV